MRRYRITPDARGYQLDEWTESFRDIPAGWSPIMNYKTWAEADEAVKRLRSKEVWYYDDAGESV